MILKKMGINNKNYLIVFVETMITLFIVMISWVIFRAESVNQAFTYISNIISPSLFSFPQEFPVMLIIITILFILAEWFQRAKLHAMQIENIKNKIIRWGIYFVLVLTIFSFGEFNQSSFIYFQF